MYDCVRVSGMMVVPADIGDLLVGIYTANTVHIYILPLCSTPAVRMINFSGRSVQSHTEYSQKRISANEQ